MIEDTRLRLFIIEAPDPMDLLQNRSEAAALEKICHLIGHEVTSIIIKSEEEFETACRYIASIDKNHDQYGRERVPLCVHISSHGNEDGLGLGCDFVTWKNLFYLLKPLCTDMYNYDGRVIIIISACQAGHQKLTKEFTQEYQTDSNFRPPAYLFITADEEPTWSDAVVSWTVFYHQLPNIRLNVKTEVQKILKRVKEVGASTLMYYRWDEKNKKYLKYSL